MLMALFMGSMIPTPLYALYRRRFGFSELVVTLIYATYSAGNLLALFLVGHASDKAGRRRTAVPSIACAMASTLLFGFARSVAWLFAARFVIGLGLAVNSSTGMAWLSDITEDKSAASVASAVSIYVGLGLGTAISGLLAQYGPAPLRLPYVFYGAVLVVIAAVTLRSPETVEDPHVDPKELVRPTLGIPRELRLQLMAPLVTAFAMFALAGFYAALVPGILGQELQRRNLALAGAITGELFLVGAAAVAATRKVPSRQAMLGASLTLPLSVLLFEFAEKLRSIPILLAGTAVAGVAAVVGYRGSLELVNQAAPRDQRAAILSSYLLASYLGNSIPVVGVGILAALASPERAHLIFAVAVAVLGLAAFATGRKFPVGNG
jgi:MFS family permease